MHTLPPLAGCTGMQMRARVTSGGKSSAIFSFWPCWEEGTGSRGGGRAPRRGSRRAGRRRARARGPGGPRRRGERRRGTRRRRSGRPAVGTTPAQPRGDAPGPARPRPAESGRWPRLRPAPPTARGPLLPRESRDVLWARGSRPGRHPSSLRVTWASGVVARGGGRWACCAERSSWAREGRWGGPPPRGAPPRSPAPRSLSRGQPGVTAEVGPAGPVAGSSGLGRFHSRRREQWEGCPAAPHSGRERA